ncbi:PCNA-associated factor [Ptiloglossa arizonensis]|uniref:PCNA-associated factor n=1 Tax=Ptiloglossa arizonensis TaxID=3350558 RepID=UPI003FA0C408
MVRTKADRLKAVGGKAPSKSVKSTPTKKGKGVSKGKNYSGGNPVHPRETPEWQKPITCFLNQNSVQDAAGVSGVQEDENQSVNEETGNESD